MPRKKGAIGKRPFDGSGVRLLLRHQHVRRKLSYVPRSPRGWFPRLERRVRRGGRRSKRDNVTGRLFLPIVNRIAIRRDVGPVEWVGLHRLRCRISWDENEFHSFAIADCTNREDEGRCAEDRLCSHGYLRAEAASEVRSELRQDQYQRCGSLQAAPPPAVHNARALPRAGEETPSPSPRQLWWHTNGHFRESFCKPVRVIVYVLVVV